MEVLSGGAHGSPAEGLSPTWRVQGRFPQEWAHLEGGVKTEEAFGTEEDVRAEDGTRRQSVSTGSHRHPEGIPA